MTGSSEPWIDLRLWRQFVAVADELHFGRAAARLHMTQPPLTQAIAGLERLLGTRLFDRTKRSVALTATGAALLPAVRELLARAQALPGRARAAAAGEMGRLRLAFVSTVGFDLLPRWVSSFRQAWPGVALELIEATGDVQQQLLDQGEVDAGFLLHAPGFSPPGLAQLSLSQEPMLLALPQTHALAGDAALALDSVLGEPLVMFPRRILPSVFDAVFALHHAAGRSPQVVQEAIQMQTIVNLVSAGLGVAWVPESVRQFQRPGVVYRPVCAPRGLVLPTCETSLVWRSAAVTPTLARLIEFARNAAVSGPRAQLPPC